MTRHRASATRAIADAVNLTTLLRWCARHHGLISISRGEGGAWRVIVLRNELTDEQAKAGVPVKVADIVLDDISDAVDIAARKVRQSPEWHRWDDAGRARKSRRMRKKAADESQGDEGALDIKEYDWDIWKSPLAEENGGKPPLTSTGKEVRPPKPRPSRSHGVLTEEVNDYDLRDMGE